MRPADGSRRSRPRNDLRVTGARAPSVPDDLAERRVVAGAGGLELSVYGWRANTGRRPALFWGHANGFAAGAYAPMLTKLAGRMDVFAADLRAHGGSADPGGAYDAAMSPDNFAFDLVATTAAVR